MWKELRRSPGWIVLLATTLGLIWGGYTFLNHASTSQVYLLNCGIVDFKPTSIAKSCGDGNEGIANIQWTSWNKDGASGNAFYSVNECIPNCADGKFLHAEVAFTITGSSPLARINGKPVLTQIYIETKDQKNLPLADRKYMEWELQ